MAAFLISFKPASENPEKGWPLAELLRLVEAVEQGGQPVEDWRFKNRKLPKVGDRVFLLLQGKRGPAIIGYGRIDGASVPSKTHTPIRFENLLDPTSSALATPSDLSALVGGEKIWRTQSSGIVLPPLIAQALEAMVVGKPGKPLVQQADRNPDWTRDELIVALNTYLQHRPNPPGKDSAVIRGLSETLQLLGEKLFPLVQRGETFRNANGVYMKLMNFRRLDPQYTADGRSGLSRGAEAEKVVWLEFSGAPERCALASKAIVAAAHDATVPPAWSEVAEEPEIEEAAEGRLLTKVHVVRERDRRLAKAKRTQVLKLKGKLACEACHFEFRAIYGQRGDGFIECHHIKPVATLESGEKTKLSDLIVLCANCHRMIHRAKPWLTLSELRSILESVKT
jgi:5-methylcytosine-specific restriction protein A